MIGDIYMVTDKHRATWGTEMVNNYFYLGNGDGIAPDLGQAFVDNMLTPIAAIQPIDINHYQVDVISLFDPTDYASSGVDVDGVQTTETSAPFLAVNYTLVTNTRAIRKGSKRIGPVPEDVIVNGVITDATYISDLETLRLLMNDIIQPTGEPTKTFSQVVVKRVREGTGPNYTYRLPVSWGEAEYSPVLTALVNLTVSHQVSRKR